MRIEITKIDRTGGTVECTVHAPTPHAPTWMQLTPRTNGGRFWTLPAGHPFERSEGQFGPPSRIITVARQLLAGTIESSTAAARIAFSLADWEKLPHG
jgi:hypothetical protein